MPVNLIACNRIELHFSRSFKSCYNLQVWTELPSRSSYRQLVFRSLITEHVRMTDSWCKPSRIFAIFTNQVRTTIAHTVDVPIVRRLQEHGLADEPYDEVNKYCNWRNIVESFVYIVTLSLNHILASKGKWMGASDRELVVSSKKLIVKILRCYDVVVLCLARECRSEGYEEKWKSWDMRHTP